MFSRWRPCRCVLRKQQAASKELSGRFNLQSYENPWTIPNILSMARMGLAPVLGYLIVEENFNVALGVFVLAGVTDLLDGFIARNWANQKSALGSALDPLADKILISVLYVSLTCANLIPVSLTSMIILRDVALIAAVFYVRYKTLSPPRTLSRYFNPCYATAQLKPTFISKMNTAVQLILVAASLAAPVFNYVDSVYLQTLWCITAFTTVTSAYSYYHYGRKTVQSIASADMDLNQLEAFLTAQTKKQGGITADQAAVIAKFWKNHRMKIHESLVNQSRWDNVLKNMSWRVDLKSQSRHIDQINTPVAIVEMELGKNGQEVKCHQGFEGLEPEMSSASSLYGYDV
ncbi:hypothetical protein llap_13172 [Limosa lapponica baueri]|uniref:COMM domain-containing protein 1 n=1 Tax=Limosa lapponica baueri TaxID=1758121 RepID=A0A2I0TS14_LIMLA|nr:hypothetical protein llap_13172 [Limosa lapponica baueri]